MLMIELATVNYSESIELVLTSQSRVRNAQTHETKICKLGF